MPGPTLAIDLERALGRALLDVLEEWRGAATDEEPLAAVLAAHALIDGVRGSLICLIGDDEMVRVAGVAGTTGSVTTGSTWPLAGSPVAVALAGSAPITELDRTGSSLVRALDLGDGATLLGLPLRIGGGGGEPTSIGVMLLAVEGGEAALGEPARDFLLDHASLVTLAMLNGAPAQDWGRRARRLHGSVDAAVDLVGSLDATNVLPRVLSRACDALDASRAALLRVAGDEVVMEGVHDVDGRPEPADWRGPFASQPLLVEALRSGAPVVGETLEPDGLPDEVRRAYADVRHIVVLPLRVREDEHGFLVVARRVARPFIHDDSDTLQLLGHVALLALRNSRLYADAQAASQAMSTLLNLVVHDLRAPLTVLSGYVDLLREGTFGEPPAEWRRPMEVISGKLSETHRLVDDVLLAARMESNAIPANLERIDLNEVIARAAKRSEARAALAGAVVETGPTARPVLVFGDGFHVDRIVDNLVNNALSYGGDPAWVRLSVDASATRAIRVEDRGTGISPELHERIFDRFFRIDHDVPGTGFGLHVGRALAVACGGSLRVERSAPGAGSVFRLELPAADPL